MLNKFARGVAACGLGFCALAASEASATNGYFANGYGGASKGMAGAGVAVPTGVLGLAQNPAMGHKVGNMAGFCLTSFMPDRSVTIQPGGPLTPGTYESDNKFFPIPCGGANWVLSDRLTFGVYLFGNGGMNTEYAPNFFDPLTPIPATSPVGINLEQGFLAFNFSYKLSEQMTLGVAPILAAQRFSATGLEDFTAFSVPPGDKVTGNGDSWSTGVGINLGILWEPTEEWDFGLAYRPKINMSAFDEYAGLFAEGGNFDIPGTVTAGLAYTPPQNKALTLTAEYQRIFYGDVPSIANSSTPSSPPPFLGTANGIGFGWKDVDVFRVGAVYRYNAKWTFRGGVSYATEPYGSESAVINTLAPATIQWHASIGASYRINDNWGVTAAYTHAFDNTITGSTPALAGPQVVSERMSQHEFAIGMTYRW